jgi:hypothetical protein
LEWVLAAKEEKSIKGQEGDQEEKEEVEEGGAAALALTPAPET